MSSYNVSFDLSVEDVELIEKALRLAKQEVSNEMIAADTSGKAETAEMQAHDTTLRQIQDLLGRLHNQKVFYRPKAGAYIGG